MVTYVTDLLFPSDLSSSYGRLAVDLFITNHHILCWSTDCSLRVCIHYLYCMVCSIYSRLQITTHIHNHTHTHSNTHTHTHTYTHTHTTSCDAWHRANPLAGLHIAGHCKHKPKKWLCEFMCTRIRWNRHHTPRRRIFNHEWEYYGPSSTDTCAHTKVVVL